MMFKSLLNLLLSVILITGAAFDAQSDDVFSKRKYICPPCYHVKDIFETKSYHEDGKCPVCGMNLIEQPIVANDAPATIHSGSGNFEFQSKRSNKSSLITVFYHKPNEYNSDSKILIVVPGAGRNAWDYRDSWVALSEKYNVLVVSPFYPKEEHDFAAYHLAGIISDIEFKNYTVSKVDGRVNKYHLADSDLIKGKAVSPNAWLFRDFDDIFDQVVRLAQSNRQSYDIFGHSAGGQILHRMAIFYPGTKADRIIAANSGSYTQLSFDNEYPFGLKGTKFNNYSFVDIFSRNLTVLVGGQDNDKEQRGTMLHTPFLDKQGLGRLSRGKYFYKASQKAAKIKGAKFEWNFCVVEGVGHDYKSMGLAAAKLLYNGENCITKMSI